MRQHFGYVALLIGLLLAPAVHAQVDQGFEFEKSGAAGFQFLKIALGARESALGEAAAAMTNDANAVFWNVGALPLIGERQVAFTHNEWIVNSSLDAVVVATPLGPYAIGLSLVRFGVEPFEETTVLEPDGTGRMVEAGDFMVGLAAARRFTDRLTIGVQAKYVIESLDDDRSAGVLFDVGALYYTGFRQLRLAFTLQHFGPDIGSQFGVPDSLGVSSEVCSVDPDFLGCDLEDGQTFRTPLLFRVAAADDLFSFSDVRVSGAVELVHPTDNNEWVNGGVEAVVMDVLALRTGYRLSVDEGAWSFGAGVTPPRIEGVGVRADYAYVPFGDLLGATHRFTVSLGL